MYDTAEGERGGGAKTLSSPRHPSSAVLYSFAAILFGCGFAALCLGASVVECLEERFEESPLFLFERLTGHEPWCPPPRYSPPASQREKIVREPQRASTR